MIVLQSFLGDFPLVVGGPDFGESEMDALRAKLAAEEIPASKMPRTMI